MKGNHNSELPARRPVQTEYMTFLVVAYVSLSIYPSAFHILAAHTQIKRFSVSTWKVFSKCVRYFLFLTTLIHNKIHFTCVNKWTSSYNL